MTEMWIAGVDIGGTTIKLAFLNDRGDILHKWEIKTNISEHGMFIVRDICQTIEAKLRELGFTKEKIIGVGVGAPGPVNLENGAIYEAVNLHWENNYPLKKELEEILAIPVIVDNDANIAAIGEMWKGTGKGAQDLVCITLGTGIGCGVIANGKIVHGINGAGGEIGHITVIPVNGASCNCGKTGCLETIASATGISRIAIEKINESDTASSLQSEYQKNGVMTAKLVFDAAKEHDALALEIVEYISFHLGLTLANVANSLNPEMIVIGGGVSKAGDILVEMVNKYFQQFAFSRVAKSTSISLATLGNDAGVIGAGWLVKTNVWH
jgi:glucokinase